MSLFAEDADELPGPLAGINTTPLVDVMLVLLIIFLITVPVVVAQGGIRLPRETTRAVVEEPGTVTLGIAREGTVSLNGVPLADTNALIGALRAVAARAVVPAVHVRADVEAPYAAVGRVLAACRTAGLQRIGFVTQPAARERAP
ncbi:ExbD/TolR family protein [Pararhodospirillum oryzae]|uniref:Biopolymer transporter ExbD n=1 Tax=Pararhodospirillum oryzae TaxID=478448 RepID=A0A512HC64_9PROT|nr:biopolymer transporter ExbD [Pararhodospirillum oryzae]GEO83042.1 biopolymer transporter ExbD [Pararhodospirillum oryzae]